MVKTRIRNIALIFTLLLLGGMVNEAWAYKVTYHILTLPMNSETGNTKAAVDGFRVEAVKAIVDDATIIQLPDHFKSPLAKNFTYYSSAFISSSDATTIYEHNGTKHIPITAPIAPYIKVTRSGGSITAEVASNATAWSGADSDHKKTATSLSNFTTQKDALSTDGDYYFKMDCLNEGSAVTSNCDIYVTYEYDADNTIAKLDGSQKYNITLGDGYVAYNRGRNNRPAVIPKSFVSSEQLASEDFVYVDVSGVTKDPITAYWASSDNKNPRSKTESQFFFLFYYLGEDPYNITICAAFPDDYNEWFAEKEGYDGGKWKRKYYKGATLFGQTTANLFISSEVNQKYNTEYTYADETLVETTPYTGFYRNYSPVWNSFAILNAIDNSGGYVYMATRNVNSSGSIDNPTKSGGNYQYYYLKSTHNNLMYNKMTPSTATSQYSSDEEMYEIYKFVFKVKTPFENIISVEREWSEAYISQTIIEHIPDALKRKYVTFEGLYSDQAFTDPITTFADAKSRCTQDSDGKYHIYVKYSVLGTLPFTPINAANKTSGYSTATWYELTDAGSAQADGKKIRWDATNSVFKNNGASGVYEKESEFAFIGDPYELRIINRDQTVNATPSAANQYVGCANPASSLNLDVNASDESSHYKWEIPYDDTSGSFTLREMNSSNAYWYWDASSAGNSLTYSTSESTRIKVMTIGKLNYTFKIVDLAGNIAIQATAEATPFAPLTGTGVGYSMIPATIRSPYIADETITFYSTYSGGGRGNLSGALTELPGTNNSIIYVAYTTSRLGSKSITLGEGQSFNVKLNGEYIYWDSSTGKVLSNASATPSNLTENQYLWRLRGRDPYAMIIDNIGATISAHTGYTVPEDVTIYADNGNTTTESRYKGAWVKTSDGSWGDSKSLVFDGDRANAARFIAMLGSYAGVYEVMAATGNDTYYHIGRVSEENAEVKMYSTSTYAHGTDQLRFILESTKLIQYHLIDKSGKEIFRNEISSRNARLALPAEYVSPLVATYHYYAGSDVNQADGADGSSDTADDIFSPKASPTDLSEAGENTEIYVFYDVDDEIGFGTSHPHLLKFLNPKVGGYKLEDGADRLTSSKIQAVYPYTNGDGSLNIYGQSMRDEQMDGGSSTRSRWVWFFENEKSDPYHVKIHSKNAISFGGRSNPTYLQTFAVHFNQETGTPNKQRVVTGGNLIGITQDKATEYAILGTKNHYKLLTIDPVAADLNGDGDTEDTGENERQVVKSFEQYWKTYNMIKKFVLEIDVANEDADYHDEFSEESSTYEMPSELWSTLKEKLTTLGINDSEDINYVDGCSWHSYDAVASAVRWNGYNDKSTGKGSKKVERLEHWYQSFDMGDGTFDIEDANIPPVLILLDRHGWEIMRKPIPLGDGDADPSAAEKLAALRVYDSPMVKEYKFYSNAQKVSNCHKYHLRMQNGAERDPIKVSGTQFTSTSLATLPPYVVDRDLYVTYTVKEEYEKSYRYSLDYTESKDENNKTVYTINSETGTPSAFIVLQNHQYAWDNSSTLTATAAPSNLSNSIITDSGAEEESKTFKQAALWYLQPNLEIDDEMGIPWPWSAAASADDPHYQAETKVTFIDKTGFDPYNLQLKNVSTGKFFTIDMKRSVLEGGQYNGDYTGGSTAVTLADACDNPISSPESYDHSTLKMTNQTFMAVQDANGNMQLMPRFDHSRRINAFVSLANPLTHATKADVDDATPGVQTTFLVRPQVFDYRIIDNDGNIAMHYQTAGESYPSIPDHFKSPLATDFKYYFGNAVYTTTESTADAWTAAGESFKKTATSDANMNAQIRDITTIGDYFFKVGSSTFTYKKVTVTNANTTSSSNGIYDDVKEGRDISGREITGSFAAAGVQTSADIFIRYTYDKTSDYDYDNILRGRWMTMSLGGKNVQYSGTLNEEGSGIYKDADTPTKPVTINSDAAALKWQWKFLQSPCISTSSYYIAPDPYSVKISNRDANKAEADMGTAIKVGNIDRFVILNHPSGDYALAAAGDGLTYSFLNGGSMTAPSTTPASIVGEGGFTTTSNTISDDARLIFTNDVTHTFTYNIITNEKLLAAHATQDNETANVNGFNPVVPEDIQSQLIYLDDYLYYGTAIYTDNGTGGITPDDEYTIDPESQIDDLYGLYEDVVYVRYPGFSRDNTPYMVPNARNNTSPIAVGSGSNDVAIDISGNLPYDIIWLDDNMMVSTDGSTISDGGANDHELSATSSNMWRFEGSDPYAIKIKRDGTNPAKYVDGKYTLNTTPKTFMLLKRDGYDYGVFAETGNQGTMLTFGDHDSNGATPYTLYTTTGDPTKFIPFALSVYHLIYHLVIAKTCPNKDADPLPTEQYVDIPYREGTEESYKEDGWKTYAEVSPNTKRIYGTTQRDLTNFGFTNHDAGKVSLGDKLEIPSSFYRPNVSYLYYVEGIYTDEACTDATSTDDIVALNNKYKGLEITKLMSDADLIGMTVRVNVAYGFTTGLETNAGEGFVTSVDQNLWYTFETNEATPYLAHYTNAWGLQSMRGRETRYTNDYLWTPLGDPYGFVMYNRYMIKNSESSTVMTTATIGDNIKLKMDTKGANAVYELLADETTTPGNFLVHPVVNNTGTKYYVKRKDTDTDIDSDGKSDLDYTILSTEPTEWTFGLTPDLIQPYIDRVGYVGGLKKTVYEGMDETLVSAIKNGTATAAQLMTAQGVVYKDANIVEFESGYYRLHNQPGVSSISPARYASGYLHDIEKTAGTGSTAIPMHFYSKTNVSTTFEGEDASNLNSGFTKTNATQGAIPVPATEYDPSTIFYINGSITNPETNPTISTATMSTQGLYVRGVQTDDNHGDATMTATTGGEGETTTFTLMDIGGAVFLIHDGLEPATRKYLNFSQSYEKNIGGNDVNMIYDLKFFHNSPTDDAKWCIEPANNQGLMIATNDGGDGYYYATFCAPFDVQLPAKDGSTDYLAYICTAWDTQVIHPTKVPAVETYAEGKFVPAGTPVIIRTTDNTGKMKLTLPKNSPTDPLTCVFTGKYLEQKLSDEITADDMVYTFGLPITGYGLTTTSGSTNGDITGLINRDQAKKGVGFYVNATPNKEIGASTGDWTPNNRYVLHNKIYYRAGEDSGASAPQRRGPEFVPVIFDDEEESEELNPDGTREIVGDGCVYDLMGRKVATREQVEDGSWKQRVATGIYIINGKKIRR